MRSNVGIFCIFTLGILCLLTSACNRVPIETGAPAPAQLPENEAPPVRIGQIAPMLQDGAAGRLNNDALPASSSHSKPKTHKAKRPSSAPDVNAGLNIDPSRLPVPLGSFRAAYVQAGSPTVAILINRSFEGSISEWSTDRRILIQSRKETFGAGRKADSENQTVTIEEQKREKPLSDDQLWLVQDRFTIPFKQAGVNLVEPKAAKGSRWVIELVISPTTTTSSDDYVMAAKVVDTTSGKILAFVTSQSLPQPMHIPGTPETKEGKPVERIAEEVCLALMEQLG